MKKTDDSQTNKLAKFRNRDDAGGKVCKALAALGELAGVDVENGKGPDDIDAALIQAAYQCNYEPPISLAARLALTTRKPRRTTRSANARLRA
jgi:hypothetical protein